MTVTAHDPILLVLVLMLVVARRGVRQRLRQGNITIIRSPP
jgi:hypothetical protein